MVTSSVTDYNSKCFKQLILIVFSSGLGYPGIRLGSKDDQSLIDYHGVELFDPARAV